MFSKASRLFFEENREISYTLTDKDIMMFQGYKTSALISSPILTICCSCFTNIKQSKYKTSEWQ